MVPNEYFKKPVEINRGYVPFLGLWPFQYNPKFSWSDKIRKLNKYPCKFHSWIGQLEHYWYLFIVWKLRCG